MAKIYVASSWRNKYHPEVVRRLRDEGHDVYDFRNPPYGGNGFRWTDIDENAPHWSFGQYAEGLRHPLAERQFAADLEALKWADACVLVLPCGRSAHTEAGWMAGAGKKVVAFIPEMDEPELMYKLFDEVVGTLDDLVRCFADTQFACQRCGACCRIPNGIVRVSDAEIARIAAFLDMTEAEFIERETEVAPDRNGLILKSRPDGACAWLADDNLCRINPVKPDKCRTFPGEWRNTDSHDVCPGLRMNSIGRR